MWGHLKGGNEGTIRKRRIRKRKIEEDRRRKVEDVGNVKKEEKKERVV